MEKPTAKDALAEPCALVGLRHFLAPLAAENLSEQGKEVDDQKRPETLVNTGFMLFRAESPSLSSFEAIFLSVFV
jgi:hypothetical protein